MQLLKCAGFAGVASESILVYAYILIYCFKELGFENEGFEVESFFRVLDSRYPPLGGLSFACERTGSQIKTFWDLRCATRGRPLGGRQNMRGF